MDFLSPGPFVEKGSTEMGSGSLKDTQRGIVSQATLLNFSLMRGFGRDYLNICISVFFPNASQIPRGEGTAANHWICSTPSRIWETRIEELCEPEITRSIYQCGVFPVEVLDPTPGRSVGYPRITRADLRDLWHSWPFRQSQTNNIFYMYTYLILNVANKHTLL